MYIQVNDQIDKNNYKALINNSIKFFNLDQETKERYSLKNQDHYKFGYSRIGEETTFGKPDQKEGLWLNREIDKTDFSFTNQYPDTHLLNFDFKKSTL